MAARKRRDPKPPRREKPPRWKMRNGTTIEFTGPPTQDPYRSSDLFDPVLFATTLAVTNGD